MYHYAICVCCAEFQQGMSSIFMSLCFDSLCHLALNPAKCIFNHYSCFRKVAINSLQPTYAICIKLLKSRCAVWHVDKKACKTSKSTCGLLCCPYGYIIYTGDRYAKSHGNNRHIFRDWSWSCWSMINTFHLATAYLVHFVFTTIA